MALIQFVENYDDLLDKPMVARCPKCSAQTSGGKFCPECGAKRA